MRQLGVREAYWPQLLKITCDHDPFLSKHPDGCNVRKRHHAGLIDHDEVELLITLIQSHDAEFKLL